MSTPMIILLVALLITAGAVTALYFMGKRTQKKQAEQQAQIEAAKQTIPMLIIDKKYMKLTESGLPQAVIDQAPRLLKGRKVPIVKAKVGPKITSLIADEKIYPLIPVKKEVKAEVSGLYIVGVKGVHGTQIKADEKLPLRTRIIRKFSKAASGGK